MRFELDNNELIKKMMELKLSIPSEDSDDYEMPDAEKQIVFRSNAMLSKIDIISTISAIRLDLEKFICYEGEIHNEAYCQTLDRMYRELYDKVANSHLFDAPQGYWHYVIRQNCEGIFLVLEDVEGDVFDNLEYVYDEINDEYIMFKADARMLTIEEYAALYGVETVTVRQWIRRGKIRTAVKAGNEWRISELSEIPNLKRGYKEAKYFWEEPIDPLPENFEFINDFDLLTIMSDKEDKNKYVLLFTNYYSPEEKKVVCSIQERERLELIMITNPKVKYLYHEPLFDVKLFPTFDKEK